MQYFSRNLHRASKVQDGTRLLRVKKRMKVRKLNTLKTLRPQTVAKTTLKKAQEARMKAESVFLMKKHVTKDAK